MFWLMKNRNKEVLRLKNRIIKFVDINGFGFILDYMLLKICEKEEL